MSRRPKQIVLVFGGLLLVLTLLVWRAVRVQQKLHAASSGFQAFTLHQRDEVTGPHVGAAANFEVRTIAVRGDGSRVDLSKEARKSWATRDIRLANGIWQTVYDDVRAVSTRQFSTLEYQARLSAMLDPTSNCQTQVGGQHTLDPGVIQGHETRLGIPVLRMVDSSGLLLWRAPSLGCVTVEHLVDWDSAHPGTNTSRLRVDAVTLGEPGPALFAVPADYSEMRPSEAAVMHLRFGKTPESAVEKAVSRWAREDAFYASHKRSAMNQ